VQIVDKRLHVVLIVFALLSWAGCKGSVNTERRSGSIRDDYVGEPLAKAVEKFEPVLHASNALIEKVRAREYQSLYRANFGPELKAGISEAVLVESLQKTEQALGAMREYKPMQWSFATGEERGTRFVRSVKVVRYERADLLISFVYPENGPYTHLIGYHTKVRKRTKSGGS
jgi:hypothetical protein